MPVRLILEMVKGPVPVFCKVTACGALDCPTMVDGNVSEVGLKFTVGVPVPVPDIKTVCGEPCAVSTNCRLALNEPVVPGVNVTLTKQVALTAKVAPHVLAEIAK